METTVTYVKTDNNKIINENCIRWVQKLDGCLEVCTRVDGCYPGINTHKICETINKESYDKLNKWFQ
jgi:hypothetical protein